MKTFSIAQDNKNTDSVLATRTKVDPQPKSKGKSSKQIEKMAKAGEVVSLYDLAVAIEKEQTPGLGDHLTVENNAFLKGQAAIPAKYTKKKKARKLSVKDSSGKTIDLVPAIAQVVADEKFIDLDSGQELTADERAEIEGALDELKNEAFKADSMADGETIPLDLLKSTDEPANEPQQPANEPDSPKGGGVVELSDENYHKGNKQHNHFASKLINGLDWQVAVNPIYDANGNIIAGFNQLARSDNGKTLRVAPASYHHTPNYVFTKTVNELAEISKSQIAGFDEFKGGNTILAYLKLNEPMTVGGFMFDDYLTIGNSHDATTSFFIGNSNTMIRCLNEFTKVIQAMKVRHTKNHVEVGIANLMQYFKEFQQYKIDLVETLEEMRTVEIDQTIKAALLERLIALEAEEMLGDRKEISKRKLSTLEAIESSISRECTDLGQNLFGLFNGITHYTTHVKKQTDRVFGSAKGGVYDMNNLALDYCIEVLDEVNPLPALSNN